MKKSLFLVTSLALLVSVASCNQTQPSTSGAPATTTTTTTSSVSSSPTSVAPQEWDVVLPSGINGVEVTASKLQASAGTKVSVFVKNKMPNSLRVNGVTMNGVALAGVETEEQDCKAYEFFMPSNQDAEVNVDVSNIYLVTVASSVSSALSLSGIGDGYFEEGEKVTFVPTTYAGYWYNSISLVNENVDLQNNADGSYSFTMPAHAVTVTAETGVNYYKVTYDTLSVPYELSFASGTSFAFGETVKFTLTPTSPDIRIDSVLVDSEELTASDGKYSFVMPSYPVKVDVEYSNVYKNFQVVNSTHFDATLKTLVNGSEVEVDDSNVVSNQTVYVDVADNLSEQDHNKVVDKVQVYGGETLETASELLNDVTKEGQRYTFVTSEDYLCYKVVVSEKDQPKQLIGEFTGSMLSQSGSRTLSFKEDGSLSRSGTDYVVKTTNPYYEYEWESYGYITSYKAFVSPNGGAVLEYMNDSYYLYSSLTIYLQNDLCPKTIDDTNLFSIITCNDTTMPSEFYSEFISFTKSDGSVQTCYYEFETSTVYWDVKCNVVSGTDGKTNGDIVEVVSSEGKTLTKMKLSKNKKTYQYRALIVE